VVTVSRTPIGTPASDRIKATVVGNAGGWKPAAGVSVTGSVTTTRAGSIEPVSTIRSTTKPR
jgi:hypothetical protein